MYLFHIWMHNSENKVFFYDVVDGATALKFLGAFVLKFTNRNFRKQFRKAAKITSAWKFPGQADEPFDVQKKKELFLLRCAAHELSPREIEILELKAAGNTREEIAEMLFISPDTVKSHLQHIYDKLDVGSDMEAVNKLLIQ